MLFKNCFIVETIIKRAAQMACVLVICSNCLYAQSQTDEEKLSIQRDILTDKAAFYENRGMKMLPGTSGAFIAGPGKYVITGNCTIAPGAKLVVKAGTTVFFENGSSIEVQGELVTKGDTRSEVIFTSLPVSDHYLPPVDDHSTWKGITVNDGAGIELNNTALSNCEKSIIISDNCKYVTFSCVSFKNSGDYHIFFDKKPVIFDNSRCADFSFNMGNSAVASEKTAAKPEVNDSREKRSPAKIVTVSLFGAAAAGCFIAGTVMHSKAKDLDRKAEETMGPDAQKYWDDRNDKIRQRNILWAIAGGSAGCGIVFTFAIPSKGGK